MQKERSDEKLTPFPHTAGDDDTIPSISLSVKLAVGRESIYQNPQLTGFCGWLGNR